jgi:hypothetical protein
MMNRGVRITGGLFALVGLLIVGGQVWIWIKLGEWRPFSVAALLYGLGIPEPHPVQSLVGLQKIIDWTISFVLNLPASLALVLIGLALFAIADKSERSVS